MTESKSTSKQKERRESRNCCQRWMTRANNEMHIENFGPRYDRSDELGGDESTRETKNRSAHMSIPIETVVKGSISISNENVRKQ